MNIITIILSISSNKILLTRKTISTHNVVFDEDTVFNRKQEDIKDILIHSILNEITI